MVPLVVSSGDPAGIGPEIVLKAWSMRNIRHIPPFVLLADPEVIRSRAHFLQLNVDIETVVVDNLVKNFQTALPVMPLKNRQNDQLGIPSSSNIAGIVEAITRGVQLIQAGHACALITCPIAKKAFMMLDLNFQATLNFLLILPIKLQINITTRL